MQINTCKSTCKSDMRITERHASSQIMRSTCRNRRSQNETFNHTETDPDLFISPSVFSPPFYGQQTWSSHQSAWGTLCTHTDIYTDWWLITRLWTLFKSIKSLKCKIMWMYKKDPELILIVFQCDCKYNI